MQFWLFGVIYLYRIFSKIRVDMRVSTGMQIQANRLDIFVLDKMTLIEVGITSQDRLVTVETEKTHKYNCK
ncbi:hypothetical protein PAEPH01_2786 [Pancytospora epiphaga]|nr:hypothetical protein PAEPH01_2786 [Pancytospora epiphaga]